MQELECICWRFSFIAAKVSVQLPDTGSMQASPPRKNAAERLIGIVSVVERTVISILARVLRLAVVVTSDRRQQERNFICGKRFRPAQVENQAQKPSESEIHVFDQRAAEESGQIDRASSECTSRDDGNLVREANNEKFTLNDFRLHECEQWRERHEFAQCGAWRHPACSGWREMQ